MTLCLIRNILSNGAVGIAFEDSTFRELVFINLLQCERRALDTSCSTCIQTQEELLTVQRSIVSQKRLPYKRNLYVWLYLRHK